MRAFCINILFFLPIVALTATAAPAFKTVVIDNDFPSGYHVAAGDIDGDGLEDIIGLCERKGGYVAWYKNPTWQKRRITPHSIHSPIDVFPRDVDKDSDLDLVFIHDFHYSDETELGSVSWLENTGTYDKPWPVHLIGREPTLHRIKWIDLKSDGSPEVLGAPILGPGSGRPRYTKTTVQLEAYQVPDDPRSSPWPERLIDDSLHLLHGLTTLDWNRDGRLDFLTASHEGVTLFVNNPQGVEKRNIVKGYQSAEGDQGASEVERGHLSDNREFLTSIEPRHGHQLVVYLPDNSDGWRRIVIDNTFNTGHALACVDLDKDGDEEILAGYRGEGTSLFIYECLDNEGKDWNRIPLDEGGMAANGLWIFDYEEDGDPDIVCAGGSTHNIKLYVNQGKN